MKQIYAEISDRRSIEMQDPEAERATNVLSPDWLCCQKLSKIFSILLCCIFFLGLAQSSAQDEGSWQTLGTAGFSPAMAQHISLKTDKSGTPYVAYKDYGNGYKATVMKFSGTTWEPVGAVGFTEGAVSHTSLALNRDGMPFVAFRDEAGGGNLSMMKLLGRSWASGGTFGASAGEIQHPSLVLDENSTTYMAFTDIANAYKLTVVKFNGSAWVSVGTVGFSAGGAYNPCLAMDASGKLYVAFRDAANAHRLRVMSFNGTIWETVGTTAQFSNNTSNFSFALDAAGTPYVAFQAPFGEGQKAVVMKFNGTQWETVGERGFSDGGIVDISLAIDRTGRPLVVYKDVTQDSKATVMKFNGTAWQLVGAAGFTAGEAGQPSLALDANGNPIVAYMDGSKGNKITVQKFVLPAPVITAQPESKSVEGDGKASFSVTASGQGDITYQWQVSMDGGVFFYDVHDALGYSGTTTPTLNILKASIFMNDYRYRVKVSNGSVVTSSPATLTVGMAAFPVTDVWQTVGTPGFSAGDISYSKVVTNKEGIPYVAYVDRANGNRATVMKYNGTRWELVGNAGFSGKIRSFLIPNQLTLALDASGTPYIAYLEEDMDYKATVMKFNGTQWQVVGSPAFTYAGGAPSLAIDANGVPYVAIGYGGAYVMKYNGKSWVTVGNSRLSKGGLNDSQVALALGADGKPYVAYADNGVIGTTTYGGRATVMRFNGTNWVAVGTEGFSAGSIRMPALELDGAGTPFVAFADDARGGKASVMKYNGKEWVAVGTLGFSDDRTQFLSFALNANGTPYIAYKDGDRNENAVVAKFNGNNWELIGNAGFPGRRINELHFSLDPAGVPYVVFDGSNKVTAGRINVMRYVPNARPTGLSLSGSSVSKNAPGGTVVGTFATTDADASDTHSYALVSGTGSEDNFKFRIEGNQLLIHQKPNVYDVSSFTIRVKTADGKINGELEKTFVIDVVDGDEKAPKGYAIAFYDKIINAGNVNSASITITGAEVGAYYHYTYTSSGGGTPVTSSGYAPAETFGVAGSKLAGLADGEITVTLYLKNQEGNVGPKVTDRIMKDTRFSKAPTAISLSNDEIEERNEIGAEIGTLSSADQDEGDTHTYTLVRGIGDSDNYFFNIEGDVLKAAQVFNFGTKSSYNIRIQSRDSGGLTFSEAKVITIKQATKTVTGIADEKNQMLRVYPNPANQQLFIHFDRVIDSVSLVNSMGATVLTKQGGAEQINLNLEALSAGVYTVLVNAKGKIYSRRIVVVR